MRIIKKKSRMENIAWGRLVREYGPYPSACFAVGSLVAQFPCTVSVLVWRRKAKLRRKTGMK